MAAVERPNPESKPGAAAEISDIQADIERTRGELGDTVETLSGKLDVADRARAAAKPSLAVVASIAGVTVVGLIWWRKRSGRRR